MQHYQRDKYGSESVGIRWLMWESISLNGGCYEGDNNPGDSMIPRRGVNYAKYLLSPGDLMMCEAVRAREGAMRHEKIFAHHGSWKFNRNRFCFL